MDSPSALDGEAQMASLALPRSAPGIPTSECSLVASSPSHTNSCRLGYTAPMKTRTALNRDMINAGDDSSADEEIDHPSIAPDAEIAYSFDAARGPSHGSQILCHALDKAIERFETKETDKLIKNEYEVLDMDLETPSVRPARKVAPEDEEYDFVDA